ncbi:MAG: hypothetical protein ACTSQG_04180 [Promethearchaeota archaeon]
MNDIDTISTNFTLVIKKLHEILEVLEKFKYNKGKKLNLNKLASSLQIPSNLLPKIAYLLLRFQ